MKISVIAPCLNEQRFALAWARNVKRYADEVYVTDTGSTDRSVEILKSEGIKVHIMIPNRVARYHWDESEIRNDLIRWATGDWIVRQDLDELWGEEFFNRLDEILSQRELFARFPRLHFWRSLYHVRIGEGRDAYRWRASTLIMWRRKDFITYTRERNHCAPQLYGLGRISPMLSSRTYNIPLFHYHHVFPLKGEYDPRRGDFNRSGLLCKTYVGSHPRELCYVGD